MSCSACGKNGIRVPSIKDPKHIRCPYCGRVHGKTTTLRMEPEDYIPFQDK